MSCRAGLAWQAGDIPYTQQIHTNKRLDNSNSSQLSPCKERNALSALSTLDIRGGTKPRAPATELRSTVLYCTCNEKRLSGPSRRAQACGHVTIGVHRHSPLTTDLMLFAPCRVWGEWMHNGISDCRLSIRGDPQRSMHGCMMGRSV